MFYKQVNFLGHSANAVHWQVYTALLVYVLLRFHAFLSDWAHTQFYASFYGGALFDLRTARPAQASEKLWDSIWTNAICWRTQSSLAEALIL